MIDMVHHLLPAMAARTELPSTLIKNSAVWMRWMTSFDLSDTFLAIAGSIRPTDATNILYINKPWCSWQKGGLHGDNELGYTANWNKPNTSNHLGLTLYRSRAIGLPRRHLSPMSNSSSSHHHIPFCGMSKKICTVRVSWLLISRSLPSSTALVGFRRPLLGIVANNYNEALSQYWSLKLP